MKIKLDKIKKKGYTEDLYFLKDGEEFIDYLCRAEVGSRSERDFIYWAYLHLNYDDNEFDKMREVLDIDTSNYVFESFKIFNSQFVCHSQDVYNSKLIYSCDGVKDSICAKNSKTIINSYNIITGLNIAYSSYTISSINIKDSADVYRCQDCDSCYGITDSIGLKDCMGVYRSENCTYTYYSQNLKNCKYCLFCDGLVDKEFHIFNREVDRKDFFIIFSIFSDYMTRQNLQNVKVFKTENNSLSYEVGAKMINFYKNFSDIIVQKIKELPYYNAKIAFDITLNNKFLIA